MDMPSFARKNLDSNIVETTIGFYTLILDAGVVCQAVKILMTAIKNTPQEMENH